MATPLPPDLDKAPTIEELQMWQNRSLQLLSDTVETILIDRTMSEFIALACKNLPRATQRLQKLEAFLQMVDEICITGYIHEEDARKIATCSHLLLHPAQPGDTPPAIEEPSTPEDHSPSAS